MTELSSFLDEEAHKVSAGADALRATLERGARARRRGRLLTALVALAVAGGGVGGVLYALGGGGLASIGGPATHIVALPTSSWRPGDPGYLARAEGRVRGSPSVGGDCVWLEGPEGIRFPVVWPAGFYARFDPLRIYDSGGHVVARGGDLIEVGGGQESFSNPRCMLGQAHRAFIIESSIKVLEKGHE
jgi:hypothetical protein